MTNKIAQWTDRRARNGLLSVELSPGWKFNTDLIDDKHFAFFESVGQANKYVREAVPCDCSECVAATAEVAA